MRLDFVNSHRHRQWRFVLGCRRKTCKSMVVRGQPVHAHGSVLLHCQSFEGPPSALRAKCLTWTVFENTHRTWEGEAYNGAWLLGWQVCRVDAPIGC